MNNGKATEKIACDVRQTMHERHVYFVCGRLPYFPFAACRVPWPVLVKKFSMCTVHVVFRKAMYCCSSPLSTTRYQPQTHIPRIHPQQAYILYRLVMYEPQTTGCSGIMCKKAVSCGVIVSLLIATWTWTHSQKRETTNVWRQHQQQPDDVVQQKMLPSHWSNTFSISHTTSESTNHQATFNCESKYYMVPWMFHKIVLAAKTKRITKSVFCTAHTHNIHITPRAPVTFVYLYTSIIDFSVWCCCCFFIMHLHRERKVMLNFIEGIERAEVRYCNKAFTHPNSSVIRTDL